MEIVPIKKKNPPIEIEHVAGLDVNKKTPLDLLLFSVHEVSFVCSIFSISSSVRCFLRSTNKKCTTRTSGL